MSGLRRAIDCLLSSDSCQVSQPTVKLTECSPDIGVVMDGQGGICTKCGVVFKSKTSLTNHLLKCVIGYDSDEKVDETRNSDDKCCKSSGSGSDSGSDNEQKSIPRLIIMKN